MPAFFGVKILSNNSEHQIAKAIFSIILAQGFVSYSVLSRFFICEGKVPFAGNRCKSTVYFLTFAHRLRGNSKVSLYSPKWWIKGSSLGIFILLSCMYVLHLCQDCRWNFHPSRTVVFLRRPRVHRRQTC